MGGRSEAGLAAIRGSGRWWVGFGCDKDEGGVELQVAEVLNRCLFLFLTIFG